MNSEKLDLQSPDLVHENVEKLAALFPNCVTETAEGKAIDFDLLKQELSYAVVEGTKERYRLEWPGKKQAIVNANLPTTKTLRPVREDSVDFDNTENLYIEGDNLEVLKLLQESYLGKIKMIFIDPPYNTGGDFIYKDNFAQDGEEYKTQTGQIDEYQKRLVANTETDGRYHSAWLTMMYPRLKLARNLLQKDGIIFITIGSQELDNLKKITDEIFGQNNFIEIIPRVVKSTSFKGSFFSPSLDYVLCYAKSISEANPFTEGVIEKQFPKIENEGDRKGEYYRDDTAFYLSSLDITRGSYQQRYWVDCPDGSKAIPPGKTFPPEKGVAGDGVWRWGPETYEKQKHLLVFKESTRSPLLDENGNQSKYNIYTKSYLKDREEKGKLPRNFFIDEIQNRKGTQVLKSLGIPFPFPKPIELLEWFMTLVQIGNNDIVLDFFAGSSTTAHAILQLNSQDQVKRKFIIVQMPEKTDEDSEAFKEGFQNICELGKERIRRAAKKIEEEKQSKAKADGLFTNFVDTQDFGFRVYRLDSSNLQDVYYRPQDYKQAALDLFADNVKPDRTADDLLAQVMLDWGLPLSLKIEQASVAGKQVFKVAGNSLYACFDRGIDEAFAKEIAKDQPLRIVFRDNGFKDDTAKTNVKQLLKQLSPETEMKVI